mgnify:CR=1 FL=1
MAVPFCVRWATRLPSSTGVFCWQRIHQAVGRLISRPTHVRNFSNIVLRIALENVLAQRNDARYTAHADLSLVRSDSQDRNRPEQAETEENLRSQLADEMGQVFHALPPHQDRDCPGQHSGQDYTDERKRETAKSLQRGQPGLDVRDVVGHQESHHLFDIVHSNVTGLAMATPTPRHYRICQRWSWP